MELCGVTVESLLDKFENWLAEHSHRRTSFSAFGGTLSRILVFPVFVFVFVCLELGPTGLGQHQPILRGTDRHSRSSQA